MTRWRAAALHLGLSLILATIVVALLAVVWFPPPYFHAATADRLAMLVIGVDVVVGPLLTLVVYKAGKPGMAFDLAVIGILQASAMLYGGYVILQVRPVFLVAAIDRFVLISANELEPEDLAAAKQPEFSTLSYSGPRLVAATLPTDPAEKLALMTDSATGGKDIERLPRFYVPYAERKQEIVAHCHPLDELHANNDEDAQELERARREWSGKGNQVCWVPVVARKSTVTMLLDRDSGMPLKAIAVSPW